MDILENDDEEILDSLDGGRVRPSLSLSRKVILIAKVNLGDALVKFKHFVEGTLGVDLTLFVHVEVKHLLNFGFMFLILELKQLLPELKLFLLFT